MNRSIMIDQITTECMAAAINKEIKPEPEMISDDDGKFTEMEVSVDPMVVLQNSEEPLSPNIEEPSPAFEDVTHLHDVDSDNVTIKLIRKGEKCTEDDDNDTDGKKDGPDSLSLKPFPCVTCKRGFYTELALKNHSWVHINDNAQFRCHTCNAGFDFKSNLISHLKTHRLGGICQFCGRR